MRQLDWRQLASRWGTIVFIVALALYFWIRSPNGVFLDRDNIVNAILLQVTPLAVLAGGLTVALVVGDFDLSIAGNAIFGTVIAAAWARDHGTTSMAFLLAILATTLVGVVNGLIITKLRVAPFIATLAMGLFILEGLQFRITGVGSITGSQLPASFKRLGTDSFLGLKVVIWIAIVVLVVLWLLLQHTVVGRYLYASGGNPTAARLSGINVEKMRILAFTISGFTAGVGGVMIASRQNLGSAALEGPLLLDAFTACFIGAATLRNGEFHILGTAIGVVVLGMMTNGLSLIGFDTNLVPVAKGVVLITAVAVSGLLRRA